MFMGQDDYTKAYNCQYESAIAGKNTLTYHGEMMIKDIIINAMRRRGWNAGELAERSKVPQPTIHRICSGEHKDPRAGTLRKLAVAFGCTEGQLRGIEYWPEAEEDGLIRDVARPVYLSPRELALIENVRHCAEEDARAIERMALLSATEAQRKEAGLDAPANPLKKTA